MWERFPPPWQMMGPNHPPMMGPNHPPIMGPNHPQMMGPNHPQMMGPNHPPMMGPNHPPMMGPNHPPMMGPGPGPGPGGMWPQRFPHPGPPMMGPDGGGPWGGFHPPGHMSGTQPEGTWNPFPNPGQMTPNGMNNCGNMEANPGPSKGSEFEHPGPSYSKSSKTKTRWSSLGEQEPPRNYEEPDSSTSFEGKRHRKGREDESEEEADWEYETGPYCEVCELYLPSEQLLWRHMSGKKHMKALKALDAGRPLSKKIQDRKAENPSSSSGEEISSIEKSFASLTADEPVVGLGFVVEIYSEKEDLFLCELCDAKCNQNNMVLHVLGLKHRMTYLKKVDPDRYSRLKKTQKRSKLTEDTRQLCKEVESTAGRGRPRYRGPKQRHWDRDDSRFEKRALSAEERRMAMEDLKRTLLQDFMSRNLDDTTIQEMLEERLQLMKDYEKRGVPFDLAKERVIEDEDRWNLLLEFERQTLSFDEAEERISYRMDLLKAYIINDCPKEEARKKVLDDEIIRDFRKDFQRLGVPREHAQKHVEKRLWMLERLHYKGFSQESASHKVMRIERELSRLLQMAKEEADKHRQVSELCAWMKAGEDLERFIETTFRELDLPSSLREAHIKLALDSLDKHKKKNLSVDKAKKKVLIEDLPIPEDDDVEDNKVEASTSSSSVESAVPASSCSVGTKEDIMQRIKVFMTKLHALLQIDQQGPDPVDREKQLALFDQLSQFEIQSLLSDMRKSRVGAVEAKSRFVDFFQQHENLRKSLFPFTQEKKFVSNQRPSVAFKMFMEYYNMSGDEHSTQKVNKPNKAGSSSDDSLKHKKARSRSRDRHGHSSKRRSRSRSSSVHHRSRRSKGRRSPSPRYRKRYHSRDRSSSPEFCKEKSPLYDQRKKKRRRERSVSSSPKRRGRKSWN